MWQIYSGYCTPTFIRIVQVQDTGLLGHGVEYNNRQQVKKDKRELTQCPIHPHQDTARCCSRTGKRRWRRRGRNWTNCHFCNVQSTWTTSQLPHPQIHIFSQWLTQYVPSPSIYYKITPTYWSLCHVLWLNYNILYPLPSTLGTYHVWHSAPNTRCSPNLKLLWPAADTFLCLTQVMSLTCSPATVRFWITTVYMSPCSGNIYTRFKVCVAFCTHPQFLVHFMTESYNYGVYDC